MTEKKTEKWEKRYEELRRRLGGAGYLLAGTITKRVFEKPDPKNPSRTRKTGPYYSWTWKEKGKTVTEYLTSEQAKTYGQAIKNLREITSVLKQMRDLSRKILDARANGKRGPSNKAPKKDGKDGKSA